MEDLIQNVKDRLATYAKAAEAARAARKARIREVVDFDHEIEPTKDCNGQLHAPCDNYFWRWPVIDVDGDVVDCLERTFMAGEFLPGVIKLNRPVGRLSNDYGRRVDCVAAADAQRLICEFEQNPHITISNGKEFEREGMTLCHLYVNTKCNDAFEMIEEHFYAAYRAARKAANADVDPCPVGRVVITGEVLGTKTDYNAFGAVQKMLVKDDRGFKVWGTIPGSITAVKGCRVTFTATIEPSKDDDRFGFYKRPTKAAILEEAA